MYLLHSLAIAIGQAFFVRTQKKNSRAPKLKKMETQEKNSNSRINIHFPAFFRAKRKKTVR